jgi:hypothetical protein
LVNLETAIGLNAQARAKEYALLIRGRIGGNSGRASPGTSGIITLTEQRELKLAALAMQPLDASEHEYSDDWPSVLKGHPIFSPPTDTSPSQQLELSTNSLPDFMLREPHNDSSSPSGRRQTMVLKDADLIVAVGKEIRVTSLGDAKLSRGKSKSYKVRVAVKSFCATPDLPLQVLHTPNIQFDVSQLALNPTRKLLAVAGTFQVAVVVLPRPGFMRLIPTTIDCKYALIPRVSCTFVSKRFSVGPFKSGSTFMRPLLQLP